MNLDQKENLDSIITYLVIKKLVTPIVKHPAYAKGLVNNAGMKIKDPETVEEKKSLTVLDKLIFKIKRLLGGKLVSLNSFLYLSTLSNEFYNKLVVKGSVNQRAEIIRIKKDIERLSESYNISEEELIDTLIIDKIQNKQFLKD
jgi:hypothetical protein